MHSPIITVLSALPHNCDNQMEATDSREAECLSDWHANENWENNFVPLHSFRCSLNPSMGCPGNLLENHVMIALFCLNDLQQMIEGSYWCWYSHKGSGKNLTPSALGY